MGINSSFSVYKVYLLERGILQAVNVVNSRTVTPGGETEEFIYYWDLQCKVMPCDSELPLKNQTQQWSLYYIRKNNKQTKPNLKRIYVYELYVFRLFLSLKLNNNNKKNSEDQVLIRKFFWFYWHQSAL